MWDEVTFVPRMLVDTSARTQKTTLFGRGYDAPFPVAEAKAGPLAFPELVPTEHDHRSAAAMLDVRDALSRWEKPALVLFSDSDRVFSPAHAELMAAHIPGALPAEIVEGAGHFLQEDRGEEIARRMVQFLAP